MSLTVLDLLAVFILGVVAYVAGYHVFVAWSLWKVRKIRLTNEMIREHIKQHPRYPFGLPITETWSAGEFICDNCGSNNYFSMMRLEPHHVQDSPQLREAAAQSDVAVETEDGVHSLGRGVYSCPAILMCHRCKSTYANGDIAKAMRQQEDM